MFVDLLIINICSHDFIWRPIYNLQTHISSYLSWCIFVCRSINYDEKDPFLCNSCGFCKYAKFDLTLLAKPCCAVDPIENEEDRKKVHDATYLMADWMCLLFIFDACWHILYYYHVHLQAISSINSLLEKADRIYKQLQLHRPVLESLLIQVAEHGSDRPPSLGKVSYYLLTFVSFFMLINTISK